MKANELRIGNWVSNGEIEFQITSKDIYHLDVYVARVIANPIPITPQWMERLGFNWSIYHQSFHYGDMAMDEFYDVNECYPKGYQLSTFKKRNLIGKSFLYVHQLQNLYFALTGEELEYKPNI